jgi:hypothetical protein
MVQPSYTLLNPTLPPNPILSGVRLNKKSDINHEKYLARLKSFYTLFNAQTHFWVEVAVWDRLYYKHINQHRPFHRFQRVQEVRGEA